MTYGLWGAWVFGLLQRRWMDGNPYNKICGLAPYHAVIKWYHNGRTAFRDIVVRGDPAVGATMSKPNTESDDQPAKVADFTSYENIELSMERFDAKGYVFGIQTPRTTGSQTPSLFRDGVLQNYINVRIPR
jgi:hypothetical protein